MSQAYILRQTSSFIVKTTDDQSTCDIEGMHQLPGGSIVLSDHSNCCLKLLDANFNVVSRCPLPSNPWDVCRTDRDGLAVGMNDTGIQFVTVEGGGSMVPTASFSTDHRCTSLSYSNMCLFVTEFGHTCVNVYDLSGTRLRTISTDQTGKQLFSYNRRIATSENGSCLYVTDNKGLVTIDTSGNHVSTFSPAELIHGPFAVCVDGVGSGFLGGFSSNNVVQVGNNVVSEILPPSEGKRPSTLCFDVVTSRLLVATRGSNTVQVLHLSK